MKTKRRIVSLILAVCIVTAIVLTGCSGKMSGTMDIDKDFNGSRVITCSVPLQQLDQFVSGGEETLAAIVEENCPKSLRYTATKNADTLTYTFTMTFADAASYRNLIRLILPQTQMSLEVGDGKLSSGVRLNEDFTDHDLMQWFDDALLASGKYSGTAEEIWEFGSTTLTYEGKTVCTTQPYAFDTYQGITLQSVCVTTTVDQNGTIERTCAFAVEKSDYEKNKEQFSAYLSGLLPEGGSVEINELADGTVVQTLWYGAAAADQFAKQTRTLFGETGLFAANVDMRSAFSSETVYSEYLVFDRFPAKQYSYYVKNSNTENAGLSDEYGSAVLEGEYLRYPVEGGSLSVSYSRRDSVKADALDIAVHYGLDGPQKVSVQLSFTGSDAKRNAENAAAWYQKKYKGELSSSVIAVNEGYRYICAVTVKDNAEAYLDQAFGIDLSYDLEMIDRFFSDEYILANGVEAANLYESCGASHVSITTHLPQGMEYKTVRQSGQTLKISGNSYTVSEADAVFRAQAVVLRKDRIILAVLIGAALLISLLLVAVLLSRMRMRAKAGIEEGVTAVLKRSLAAIFSGRLDAGADIDLIRCFYGRRGPQTLVFVGIVVVPLCWSILYLICYDYANSFYFFSGMLRYVTGAIFAFSLLTLPVSLVWRQYQKAGTDAQTVQLAAQKTEQTAKTETAHLMMQLAEADMEPLKGFTACVPDAFVKRSTASRRLFAKLLRQYSRRFPDVEAPVCILQQDESVCASRSLLQNMLVYPDHVVLKSCLINAAFGTVTPLDDVLIPRDQLLRFETDDLKLIARYRDGRKLKRKKLKYLKIRFLTKGKETIVLFMPDDADAIEAISQLKRLFAENK